MWLLPQKNELSEQKKLPTCRQTTQEIDYRQGLIDEKAKGRHLSETPLAGLRLVFRQKTRRAEVKPLSPALCSCATHPRALFAVVSSANLLFFFLSILGAGLTLLFNCFPQKQWSRQKKRKKRGWMEEVKHALKWFLLKVMGCFPPWRLSSMRSGEKWWGWGWQYRKNNHAPWLMVARPKQRDGPQKG